MPRVLALTLACVVALLAAVLQGCGGGVSAGASVRVYAVAPLCSAAREALAAAGGEAGDLRVRLTCLPATGSGGGTDLAVTGANARRATEDSSSIAFLEAAGPTAKYSQSILEAADIAWIQTHSGGAAMERVLDALSSDSGSPRDAVRQSVG